MASGKAINILDIMPIALNQLIVIGRSIAQAHGAAASKVGQAERGE
jgi:hypothetical protein